MRKIAIWLLFAGMLFGCFFAASHSGDGTYKLYINDSIKSDNNYTIKLIAIGIGHGRDLLEPVNATYTISRSSFTTVNRTLEEDENYTATAKSGSQNMTVTLVRLGNESGNDVIRYYAMTDVESIFYVPVIDVNITSLSVDPDRFSAEVKWKTNVSSNGTVRLYDSDGDYRSKIDDGSKSTSHTKSFSGLDSGTNYSVMVTACTNVSCVNSSLYKFATDVVVPAISEVRVLAYGDTWANIYWETDVDSDEKVYYRKAGSGSWSQAPPKSSPWEEMQEYIAYEPGVIYGPPGIGPEVNPWEEFAQEELGMKNRGTAIMLASGSYSGYSSFQNIFYNYFITVETSGGSYRVNSDVLSSISNTSLLGMLVRHKHQINLKDLEDETNYEYIVSSCADRCANSSIYSFSTNRTLLPPTIEVAGSKSPIYHGTSEVLYIRFYVNNPGATLASAGISWEDDGTKSVTPVFLGDSRSFAPAPVGGMERKETVLSITFEKTGMHKITLRASDSIGMNNSKEIYINVLKANTSCKNTNAMYYPSDTSCTNTWPYEPQGGVEYNTGIDKCHAFEVCDPSIDYVLSDAESCCNGQRVFSSQPTQNWGYGYDKNAACDLAITNTRNAGAMTSLAAESSMKLCKASYIVYGVGSQAVYMKDYYTGEFCCSDSDSLCPGLPHFTAAPWPQSNIQFGSLLCYYTKYDPWFGDTQYFPKKGWYASDTDPTQNNNAALDLPPHSSINIMNTGTCVDYSFTITTLLRKAGFGKSEIITARAPGHLYNIVWLPGDSEYTFIDTVGNTGGDFFTGPGWGWTAGGGSQNHCTYTMDRCSNDFGAFTCPSKSQVKGC